MLLPILVALCAFLVKVVFASQTTSFDIIVTPENITKFREPSPFGTRPLESWVEIFKSREGDRKGGINLHRLLEVDPVPPQTPTRIISTCLKYSEKLGHAPKNSSDLNSIKLAFWEEIKPFGLSLLHPLCFKVMADCGDILNAQNLVELVESNEVLICSNFDLLTRIPDYSLLTPSQVQVIFEPSVSSGLNLSKIPNVLSTLKPESLIKLMELLTWDMEDWEMRTLVEARGGIEGLIKDFGDHLNSWGFLMKFPWVMKEISGLPILESLVTRLLTTLESRNYDKNQMFISIINLIASQEFLLNANFLILNNSEIVDEKLKNSADEWIKMILMDKLRLNQLLKESEDFKELYVLSTTPLSSNVPTLGVYENELPGNLLEFIENWKQLVESYLNTSIAFVYGSTARILMNLVIVNYSDEAVDEIIEFYQQNRLRFMNIESIFALKRAWPLNEKVIQLETNFYNSDVIFFERFIKTFKEICKEASTFYLVFFETRFDQDRHRNSIVSWVSFQLRLQDAGNFLKQYDQIALAERFLPLLLKDQQVGGFIEEYSNVLLSSDVIKWLLENDQGQGLLRMYPKLLHGLGDYKSFSGTNFQSLSIDFSKIRRGLSTIPAIQLINFMKSKQGLIDDPVGVLAAVPLSAWKTLGFVKHFSIYFRAPLVIEEVDYIDYIDSAFIGPENSSDDANSLLWSAVKFAINNEILYQEMKVSERKNFTGAKAEIVGRFIKAESIYRSEVIYRLTSKNVEDSTLKSFYDAVIKTLKSVPLSRDRLNELISAATKSESGDVILLILLNLFPSFSLKNVEKNYAKSLQNFKILVVKLGETEEIKMFWLYLLSICAGDVEEVQGMLGDERIPIYYRVLGKRIIERI